MAKAKRRVATRKKSSKRAKVSAKRVSKKAAKRTKSKKAKSKIAVKKAPRKAPRQVVEVEDTIIDVIEEPVPGVVVVTEYETLRPVSRVSPSRKPKRGANPGTKEQ
jgi:hypothetical protein